MMLESELLAPRPWTHFVAAVRVATPPLPRIERLPDGTTGLLFRLIAPGDGVLLVLGPSTTAQYKRPPPFLLAMHVVFRPGAAYPFFGVPLDELADRIIPARKLWGPRADRLLDDLLSLGTGTGASHMAARRDAIGAALDEHLRGRIYEPASAAIARAAVERLSAADTPIGTVAAELRISARNLRRAFAASVGISPKLYARFARLQRAVGRADAARGRWAEVARAVGYANQSHLVSEFRALTGLSPAAFARGDRPAALQPCLAGPAAPSRSWPGTRAAPAYHRLTEPTTG